MGINEMSATGAGGPLLLIMLTLVGSLVSLILEWIRRAREQRLQDARDAAAGFLRGYCAGTDARARPRCGALLTMISGNDDRRFRRLYRVCDLLGNSGLWLGHTPGNDRSRRPISRRCFRLPSLAGFGLPVLIDIHQAILGRSELSVHSRTVLKLTAAWISHQASSLLDRGADPATFNGG